MVQHIKHALARIFGSMVQICRKDIEHITLNEKKSSKTYVGV